MTVLYNKRKTIKGFEKLKKISYSTLLVLDEAERQGIEWKKLRYTDIFELKHKGVTKYFHAQTPSETTELAYYCCKNKRVVNNILADAGISTSKGYLILKSDDQEYQRELFHSLQKPLVVKPADDLQGNNVYLNIRTEEACLTALKQIHTFYGQRGVEVLVEQMFAGDEYRILATREKILSVIKRVPANVIGDGILTIAQLIELKNADPRRTELQTYKTIIIDEELVSYLHKQTLHLGSILEAGQQVFLRPHSPKDISLGGDTVDVTDQVHTDVHQIVQRVMQAIPGLALAGIDYMTTDISAPQEEKKYIVIEVNASPSLDWNQFPLIGKERNIALEFLRIMFPDLIDTE